MPRTRAGRLLARETTVTTAILATTTITRDANGDSFAGQSEGRLAA